MLTWLLLSFVHIFHCFINGCVTSLIKERDTSCASVSLPALTGLPFPKVLHRSETGCLVKSHSFKYFQNNLANVFHQRFWNMSGVKMHVSSKQVPHSLSRGKKSIFARQIAAQRVKEGTESLVAQMHPATVQKNDSSMETEQCHATDDRELSECLFFFHQSSPYFVSVVSTFLCTIASSGPRLVSGQGLLGPDSSGETQRIHRENQATLQGMSPSEILQEQRKLLSQLGSLFCETF